MYLEGTLYCNRPFGNGRVWLKSDCQIKKKKLGKLIPLKKYIILKISEKSVMKFFKSLNSFYFIILNLIQLLSSFNIHITN